MLSVAALNATAVATPMTMSVFSPSKHPFMKRVMAAPTHFSFDPYKLARSQMMPASMVVAAATMAAVRSPVAAATLKKAAMVTVPAPAPAAAPAVTVRVGATPAAAPVVAAIPAVTVAAPTPAPQTAAAKTSLNFRAVAIAFKQGVCNYRAPFRVVEGDVVIVEGDRGEHIGTIKTVYSAAESEAMAETVTSKIVRRATAADLEALAAKTQKEATVLEEVSKIAKELRLNATIADVEFQLDNNKLTIFVERATSSTFVDFRKVQRTLFKMFHCRIWFVYMDELTI